MRQDRFGSVLVLVLSHPPVYALTPALVRDLTAALDRAAGDPSVAAVVLRGQGRCFSAGADLPGVDLPGTDHGDADHGKAGLGKAVLGKVGLKKVGQVARMAELAGLCRRIESFPRPVIAALHGAALGAGCELALAAHYRIARASALMGLPEVGLGLLPGAGATQRLPRLIGASQALRLLAAGLPLPAPEALAIGLVDRMVTDRLGEAALAMALEGLPTRPTAEATAGLRDMAGFQAAVAAARLANRGNALPAPGRIIDCVEAAAVLPFEMGLAMEAVAFEDLAATPQAQGLRHAFLAERRALQRPAEATTGPVGELGGELGGQRAGRSLPEVSVLGLWGAGGPAPGVVWQALASGLRVVLCDADRLRLADALHRIAAMQEKAVAEGHCTEAARDAEAGRLSSAIGVGALAGADLVLAVDLPQGSGFARLGAATGQGGAGLTVAAGPGGLAELSFGPGADPDLIARLVALGRRLGWRVVAVGPDGPVELGLRLALEASVQRLLALGHGAETVQTALAAFGMGPALHDLPAMPKGGLALIRICLASMAAEGARMLADGRARRPCDIDAVALVSGLMPRWQGGPMFQADRRGLLLVRADLQGQVGEVFAVPPVLDALIAEGKRFCDLDGR